MYMAKRWTRVGPTNRPPVYRLVGHRLVEIFGRARMGFSDHGCTSSSTPAVERAGEVAGDGNILWAYTYTNFFSSNKTVIG